MKISQKLILVIFMIILLSAIFRYYTIIKLEQISEISRKIRESTEISETILDFNAENFRAQLEIQKYIYEPTEKGLMRFESHNKTLSKLLEQLIKFSEEGTKSGQTTEQEILLEDGKHHFKDISSDLKKLRVDWDNLFKKIKELEAVKDAGYTEESEPYEKIKDEVEILALANKEFFDEFVFNLKVDKFVVIQSAIVKKLEAKQESLAWGLRNMLVIILGVLIVFGAGISIFFSRSISRPLVRLKEAAIKIGEGKLSTHIETESKDEIGDLAQAFNQMAKKLRKCMTSVNGLTEAQNKLNILYQQMEKKNTVLSETKNDLLNMTKELEEGHKKLEERNFKLKEYATLKDNFLSTVSHELRTPLTTVEGFVSILSKEVPGKLTKDQSEYIDIIKNNIDRLTRLVEDLLDISRIEAGRVKLKKTAIDITDLTENVVSTLKATADTKNITLETSLLKGPPNIYLDSDRITQVFTNLISNAIKFTPEKGQITVRVEEKDAHVECSVMDNGCGIAAENLDKVFGRFQQIGRKEGPGYKGTGLGLTITREIVQMHGGTIWVDSQLKKGSQFIFTLPKHNKEEILYENIENSIFELQEENKNLFVFICKLNNYFKQEKQLGKEEVKRFLKKVLKIFENKFQNTELAMINENGEIVISVKLDQENASEMNVKLKRALKDSFIEVDEAFEINFSYGYSLYPQMADNAGDLLDKAYDTFVNEKEEQSKKKIMIVDDELAVRELLSENLKSFGYDDYLEAEDGEQALAQIENSTPDLIILDMNMPKMNGYEVIGRLKGNGKTKNIPILIMTGGKVELKQLKTYTEQAIPIIGKVYDRDQLQRLIAYLL